MLIDFTVENFLSFKEQCVFSCLATSEKQHTDRLSEGVIPRMKILPTVAIFGGNGSGKSNLVRALQFCRFMVIQGVSPEQRIPLSTFRLNSTCLDSPSRFCIRFMVADKVFRYAFAVTTRQVVEETLIQERNRSELVIFKRIQGDAWEMGGLTAKEDNKEREFLKFKQRDTLPNQLFLNEMRGKGIDLLEQAISWFRDCIEVIEPHTHIKPFEIVAPDEQLEAFASSMLRHADTGITHVQFEPLETVPFSENDQQNIRMNLKDEKHSVFLRSDDGRRIRIRLKNEKMVADRLVTFHQDANGKTVRFEIMEESHGTRRLIDLLPLFYTLILKESRKVFVCDELDGNLHPLIIQALLKDFHESCGANARAQLIFTSHDATLFDQYILRRDELWMCSKKNSGATYLESLSEYKDVRVGTDIHKGYMLGRYSGVPRVQTLLQGGIT